MSLWGRRVMYRAERWDLLHDEWWQEKILVILGSVEKVWFF